MPDHPRRRERAVAGSADRYWPVADLSPCPLSRRCWRKSRHQSASCAVPFMSTRP